MNDTEKQAIEAIGRHVLPAWEELPDLELYMDQVLSLISRYLPAGEDKALTASMVNNYVKQKVLPPPVSKRYDRSHIAALLMLCTLKSVMPIAAVQQLFRSSGGAEGIQALYDEFRAVYAQSNQNAARQLMEAEQTSRRRFLSAALSSQAAQSLASALLSSLCGET